jgi:hypothetical protein
VSEEKHRGQLPLDLCFPEEQLAAASYAPVPGGEGGLFSCSIGSLTEDIVAALERAARVDTPVRLQFSERPLLLDHVTVERKGPHSVRIVGQVVRGATA